MQALLQDIRYAFRSLRKNPAFTAVAVLTLALGIGANATVFGVINAIFLTPPPGVSEPDRVKRIYIVRNEGNMRTPEGGPGMYADLRDIRTGMSSFSSLAGQLSPTDMDLGRGGSAQQVTGQVVTGEYFLTLGIQPAMGRFFGPAEDNIAARPVVVISHRFWLRGFRSDPKAVGQEIRLDGDGFTVIGVAPEHFRGINPEHVDVWVPAAAVMGANFLVDRNYLGLRMFGRLTPGVPSDLAASEATAALRHAAAALEDLDPTPGVMLGPLNVAGGPRRSEPATVALWLALVTAIVLLIACANVANLLLARSTQRKREIAVRISLGAGRRRLVTQLLTESMFLALLGGAAGLLLAVWGKDIIRMFPLPPLPSVIDTRMLGFTLGVSVLTAILFGLVPALQATRTNLVEGLRNGAPAEGPARSRTGATLLVAQVALSLVLLTSAGLLVRSFIVAQSIDLGLEADRLLYVTVDLDNANYSDAAQLTFHERAMKRLSTLPGADRVGIVQITPLSGAGMGGRFEIPGRDLLPEAEEGPYVNFVGPTFFRTVGTSLYRGRTFTEFDREGSHPVAVVNEAAANLYWPGANPVGECIHIGARDSGTAPVCTEVVGVVESIRHRALEAAIPKYYLPLRQSAGRGSSFTETIIVRTRDEPKALIGQVRAAVQGLAPDLPFVSVIPVTDFLAPALRPFRLGAILFSLFGVLALLLAAVGLYGVVAFGVARQTREIGVRIALGAGRGDVLRLVVFRSVRLTLIGAAIGVVVAAAVSRFMEGLLYGVDPLDPATFIAATLLLVGIGLLASYIPAHRATRVDPNVALRAE